MGSSGYSLISLSLKLQRNLAELTTDTRIHFKSLASQRARPQT